MQARELGVCTRLHSALIRLWKCPWYTHVPNPGSGPSLNPLSAWKAVLLAVKVMRGECGQLCTPYLLCHVGVSETSCDVPFLELSCSLTNGIIRK